MADTLLIDSTVLIDEQRGDGRARDFLEPLLTRGVGVLHPVSAAEAIAGVINRKELAALDRLIAKFRLAHTRQDDFKRAISFVRQFALSHRVGWPDCLISATAIRLGMPVVTLNDRHFRVFGGLTVIRPY